MAWLLPEGGPFNVPGADTGCWPGFVFELGATGTVAGSEGDNVGAVTVAVAPPVLGGTTISVAGGHEALDSISSDDGSDDRRCGMLDACVLLAWHGDAGNGQIRYDMRVRKADI